LDTVSIIDLKAAMLAGISGGASSPSSDSTSVMVPSGCLFKNPLYYKHK
jgi:hypothetical protein